MSDMSNIDSEKILAATNQLDGIVDRMNGCTSKFADAIASLDKGWYSEIKTTFMTNYQVDWQAMQEMLEQLREINTILRESASDFDKTENEIVSSVKALG